MKPGEAPKKRRSPATRWGLIGIATILGIVIWNHDTSSRGVRGQVLYYPREQAGSRPLPVLLDLGSGHSRAFGNPSPSSLEAIPQRRAVGTLLDGWVAIVDSTTFQLLGVADSQDKAQEGSLSLIPHEAPTACRLSPSAELLLVVTERQGRYRTRLVSLSDFSVKEIFKSESSVWGAVFVEDNIVIGYERSGRVREWREGTEFPSELHGRPFPGPPGHLALLDNGGVVHLLRPEKSRQWSEVGSLRCGDNISSVSWTNPDLVVLTRPHKWPWTHPYFTLEVVDVESGQVIDLGLEAVRSDFSSCLEFGE